MIRKRLTLAYIDQTIVDMPLNQPFKHVCYDHSGSLYMFHCNNYTSDFNSVEIL